MGLFGVGQAVRRVEDQRFLTGQGRFTADMALPDQAVAVVVRAPMARALIQTIETREAEALPGVLAVLTAADVDADGLGGLPPLATLKNSDDSPMARPPRPLLARREVRHQGEAVAFVVAETLLAAQEAAEAVLVEYEPLPAVTDAVAALEEGAPWLHPEAPGNVCFEWERGDAAAVAEAFTNASHITRLALVNNRLIANSIEPRAAIGAYDAGCGCWTLYSPTQGPHLQQWVLSRFVFRCGAERVRVVTPDVGGGFGMKIFPYPEQALVCWAAQRLGRPVKWVADRTADSFVSDSQGRDNHSTAALALDAQGRLLGLQVSTIANLGAYLSAYGAFIPTRAGTSMLVGVYDIPAAHVQVAGVFTNTVPVDAYRGAGRPEAIYVIERLMDQAARELGLDPAELRRRNVIPPERMPYTTALGETYDSGRFAEILDKALARADWEGAEKRRQAARERGRLFGIGLAYYVEVCASGSEERASLSLDSRGRLHLRIGTQSTGQGHETAYAQLAAGRLGLDLAEITVEQGDTETIPYGRGTDGSRSLVVGGSAVLAAADALLAKLRPLAARLLQASEGDLVFAEGAFSLGSSGRSIALQEVARSGLMALKERPRLEKAPKAGATTSVSAASAATASASASTASASTASASTAAAAAEPLSETLAAEGAWRPQAPTYPNGCHICELEIDPDTGEVWIQRYTVVDDFGVVLNPMLVAGQVQGGIAQGVGQALKEQCVFDDSGQLLSGSLMDYCLPRATDLPFIDSSTVAVPCRTNPLGAKGCGEAGTIGAAPAVMNALADALAHEGRPPIDMPATPLRLWTHLHG